jgi:hypothetical protein
MTMLEWWFLGVGSLLLILLVWSLVNLCIVGWEEDIAPPPPPPRRRRSEPTIKPHIS